MYVYVLSMSMSMSKANVREVKKVNTINKTDVFKNIFENSSSKNTSEVEHC